MMKKLKQSSDQFPNNALHIFAENAPVNGHNQMMLDNIEIQLILVPTIVFYQKIAT